MKRSYVVIGIVIVLVAGVVGYLLLVPGASDFLAKTQIIEDQAQIDEMALAYIAQPYPDDYNTTRIPGYLDNRSERSLPRSRSRFSCLPMTATRLNSSSMSSQTSLREHARPSTSMPARSERRAGPRWTSRASRSWCHDGLGRPRIHRTRSAGTLALSIGLVSGCSSTQATRPSSSNPVQRRGDVVSVGDRARQGPARASRRTRARDRSMDRRRSGSVRRRLWRAATETYVRGLG